MQASRRVSNLLDVPAEVARSPMRDPRTRAGTPLNVTSIGCARAPKRADRRLGSALTARPRAWARAGEGRGVLRVRVLSPKAGTSHGEMDVSAAPQDQLSTESS